MYAQAKMTAMRFDSRRDAWLVLLLRGLPIVILAVLAIGWDARHRGMAGPIAGVLILIVFEAFFFESLLRSTYYIIDGDTLIIRSSFLKWRVPIAKILSVTPTRSPVSSPALSLDRLAILYDGKRILVSPQDKRRFIEALRAINPAIST
ncbi:MAG: PH domain-containing protein [Thermoanaerobaculia bacterium]